MLETAGESLIDQKEIAEYWTEDTRFEPQKSSGEMQSIDRFQGGTDAESRDGTGAAEAGVAEKGQLFRRSGHAPHKERSRLASFAGENLGFGQRFGRFDRSH